MYLTVLQQECWNIWAWSSYALVWQACLKKTGVELELLTDMELLLMAEKGIRGELYHTMHQPTTANNKYMRKHSKDKELSYLMYWDANNLWGWPMS